VKSLLFVVFAISTTAVHSAEPASTKAASGSPAASLQGAGLLDIRARFNSNATILVSATSEYSPASTVYSSGERLDNEGRMLAIRIGTHTAVLNSGSLWTFPLVSGESGTAVVTFDQLGVPTTLIWKITRKSDSATVIDAEVDIPFVYSIRGTNARMKGTWSAEFDSSYPIPVRSTLKTRATLRPSENDESTNTSWTPRP
jgi:hypothetical protein